MKETWVSVAGYEGFYEVSNLGRVRSLSRIAMVKNRWGGLVERKKSGQILKPTKGPYDYMRVTLQRNGAIEGALVHRLVCTAFHGPCPEDKEHCAHWDGDATNNRADNLRWVTAQENGLDRIRQGRGCRGEDSPIAKLTEGAVRDIRSRHASGEGTNALAQEYGVAPATVSNVITRKRWKHI